MLLSIIGELRVGTSPRPVMATRLIVPEGLARGRLERRTALVVQIKRFVPAWRAPLDPARVKTHPDTAST
jgi:hypothetical protein